MCRDAIYRVHVGLASPLADAINRVPTNHPEGWKAWEEKEIEGPLCLPTQPTLPPIPKNHNPATKSLSSHLRAGCLDSFRMFLSRDWSGCGIFFNLCLSSILLRARCTRRLRRGRAMFTRLLLMLRSKLSFA